METGSGTTPEAGTGTAMGKRAGETVGDRISKMRDTRQNRTGRRRQARYGSRGKAVSIVISADSLKSDFVLQNSTGHKIKVKNNMGKDRSRAIQRDETLGMQQKTRRVRDQNCITKVSRSSANPGWSRNNRRKTARVDVVHRNRPGIKRRG